MNRCRWGVLLAMVGLLLVAGSAIAQDDMIVAGGPKVVAETPAQAEQMARLEVIRADPEGAISELMGRWAPAAGASQLEAALRAAGPGKLYTASQATSFKEVERILLGPGAGRPFDGAVLNTLGDTTQDYVFTPVTPCRIFDTRNIGTPIAADGTMQFFVYGPGADLTPQGGEAAGCPAPKGEPRAVHLNLTVVPVGAQGNVRVYPANVTPPTASAVNFKLGTNIANAMTVGTYYALGPREIGVQAKVSAAHVVGDVMGYYYDAPTPSFSASRSASQNVTNIVQATVIFNTEDHDTGFDYSTTTGIFTVPETGLYNVICHLQYCNVTNITRANTYLVLNGSTLSVSFGGTSAQDDCMGRTVTGTWHLAAADALRCDAFVNGSTNAYVTAAGPGSHFSATRVR